MQGRTTGLAKGWAWPNRKMLVPTAFLMTAAALAPSGTRAAPYTFTLTGDITGTIGGQALTNDPFTWTLVGNAKAPTMLGARSRRCRRSVTWSGLAASGRRS